MYKKESKTFSFSLATSFFVCICTKEMQAFALFSINCEFNAQRCKFICCVRVFFSPLIVYLWERKTTETRALFPLPFNLFAASPSIQSCFIAWILHARLVLLAYICTLKAKCIDNNVWSYTKAKEKNVMCITPTIQLHIDTHWMFTCFSFSFNNLNSWTMSWAAFPFLFPLFYLYWAFYLMFIASKDRHIQPSRRMRERDFLRLESVRKLLNVWKSSFIDTKYKEKNVLPLYV